MVINFAARRILIGIPNPLAKPLPEPFGIMPNTVSEFTNPEAVSFTVPSPPMATTISYPSVTDCLAIS